MGNGKLIIVGLLAGLALTGILVTIILLGRGTSGLLIQNDDESAGRRLLLHYRDRDNYRLYVGVPPADPRGWEEVADVAESSITLRDSRVLKVSEVTSYFVTYPKGTLVDYHSPTDLPLPPWVRFPEEPAAEERDELTREDLKEGSSLFSITFGRSTSRPDSRDHYSTTLTNTSGKRVRVLKFAGYTKVGRVFALNTITGRFFTAEDFREWYDQRAEWIEPGQSVTDPNNYGSPPVLWAYYCEAEDGRRFIVGGIIE